MLVCITYPAPPVSISPESHPLQKVRWGKGLSLPQAGQDSAEFWTL